MKEHAVKRAAVLYVILFAVWISAELLAAQSREPFWRRQDSSVSMRPQDSQEKTRSAETAQANIVLPKAEDNVVVPLGTIWKIIAGLAIPIFTATYFLIRWFWGEHEKDIKGISERAEKDVKELKEHVETNRREMREGIIGLHLKIETNVAAMGQKQDRQFEQIMGALTRRPE